MPSIIVYGDKSKMAYEIIYDREPLWDISLTQCKVEFIDPKHIQEDVYLNRRCKISYMARWEGTRFLATKCKNREVMFQTNEPKKGKHLQENVRLTHNCKIGKSIFQDPKTIQFVATHGLEIQATTYTCLRKR